MATDTPSGARVAYRDRVRAYLREHSRSAPSVRADDISPDAVALRRAWQRRLMEGGLAGVTWPVEFGGQGLAPAEQAIADEELEAAGVPGVFDFIGVGMLGPTILVHGSEEQKQRYLAPMLAGDELWCQLFSEPAAGSDLAGIHTRAKRQDDGSWIVNGQKVWTTNAQFASYGLMLARVDPDVPKHKGLAMFIVPMDASGVKVLPLRRIAGDAHFNEVFLDDVRLDAGAVVGAVGDGWKVALTTLMFERASVSMSGEEFGVDLDKLIAAVAADGPASVREGVRERLGEVAVELLAVRLAAQRGAAERQDGRPPGPEAGLNKVTLVNAAAAAGELLADVLGPEGLADGAPAADLTSLVPGLASAGGTEQILRNTIGERVLGLPGEPRVDKDVPFRELKRG
jgi:alkylation response protein AidB-like acyl-CoA dehydrogenase